jgi:hypothetical protein
MAPDAKGRGEKTTGRWAMSQEENDRDVVSSEFYARVQELAPMCRASEGFKVLLVTPWCEALPWMIEFCKGSRIIVGSYRDEKEIDALLGLEYDWIALCGPRLSEGKERMLLTALRWPKDLDDIVPEERDEFIAKFLAERKAECVATWPQKPGANS